MNNGFCKARPTGSAIVKERGFLIVRVHFLITDGPDSGSRITYNGQVSQKSANFVRQDLTALGWRGESLDSIDSDLDRERDVVIEITHMSTKDGSRQFPVVRSIGREAKATETASSDDIKNANLLLGGKASDVQDEDIPF